MQTLTAPATTQMVTVLTRSGELVRRGGGRVQVGSKSAPGTWHDVTLGVCDCLGFLNRGTCRHIAFAPPQPEPPTPTPPAACPRCGRPTTPKDAGPLAKYNECQRCRVDALYGPDDEVA